MTLSGYCTGQVYNGLIQMDAMLLITILLLLLKDLWRMRAGNSDHKAGFAKDRHHTTLICTYIHVRNINIKMDRQNSKKQCIQHSSSLGYGRKMDEKDEEQKNTSYQASHSTLPVLG